tara:strand:+ start:1701 stop:2954 length:1254 start_codon:yes stop_codon:yes gene_type:complete
MDENIIIALALKDNSIIDEIKFLKPEHFTKSSDVYAKVLSIYHDRDGVSGTDLILEGVDFDYTLSEDDNLVSTKLSIIRSAKKMHDKYQMNLLKKSLDKVNYKGFDESLDAVKKIVSTLEAEWESEKEIKPIDLDAFIKEIREARKKEIKLGLELKTLPTMNRTIGGIMPSDLIGIYGKEKSSKTSLVHEIVLDLAVDQKIPVAIFNFEMSAKQMIMKTVSMRTGLAVNEMRNPEFTQLTNTQFDEHLRDMALKYEGSELFIVDDVYDEIQIYNKAKELKRLYGIKLIVVDYLMLINSYKKFGQRRDELNYLTRFFKQMTQKLKIPIILISQANDIGEREAEAKGLSRDSNYYFYVQKLSKGDSVDYGDYQYTAEENDYLIHNRGIRHAEAGKPFVTRFIDNYYKEIDTRRFNGLIF